MTNPPTWALFNVDLAETTEEELGILLDTAIDEGTSLAFRDTRESEDIRAVCISWSAYLGLVSRALPPADAIEDKVRDESLQISKAMCCDDD